MLARFPRALPGPYAADDAGRSGWASALFGHAPPVTLPGHVCEAAIVSRSRDALRSTAGSSLELARSGRGWGRCGVVGVHLLRPRRPGHGRTAAGRAGPRGLPGVDGPAGWGRSGVVGGDPGAGPRLRLVHRRAVACRPAVLGL